MHLVAKQIKGHEYFYLVEKARVGRRVVTTQTLYVGDRRKLVEMLQQNAAAALPSSFESQSVGADLALATIASELGIEEVVDAIHPVREGAAPVGRRLVLAAIHRIRAARHENGLRNLRSFYEQSVLSELLPVPAAALDGRRMCELLGGLTAAEVDRIETAVVRALLEHEGVSTQALAFDCTNFDSYAGAKNPSRLLKRGHAKSCRPLRVLGMGMLATADEGIPLVTFTYPGNQNDVTAFGRFLRALDRRRASLQLPLETTIAGDGGNVSRQLLLRLEKDPRYYVMRLPPHHLHDVTRCKRGDLDGLMGRYTGKVWAKKHICNVYGVERCVVDVYSRRMHQRQLPGLRRDRNRARAELLELQRLLEQQRAGQRRAKPLTLASLKRRLDTALAREHMASLFRVTVAQGKAAPTLSFEEPAKAWQELDDYVLGRTLLVTNRVDWSPEDIVTASRVQSYNERLNRDLKEPSGVLMVPLRHRRDATLRAHALVVILGVMLAKIAQRRVRKAGVSAPSLVSVVQPLVKVERAHVQFPESALPALRALAKATWVPSARTPRQTDLLRALQLEQRPELGTTLTERLEKGTARRRTGRSGAPNAP